MDSNGPAPSEEMHGVNGTVDAASTNFVWVCSWFSTMEEFSYHVTVVEALQTSGRHKLGKSGWEYLWDLYKESGKNLQG